MLGDIGCWGWKEQKTGVGAEEAQNWAPKGQFRPLRCALGRRFIAHSRQTTHFVRRL